MPKTSNNFACLIYEAIAATDAVLWLSEDARRTEHIPYVRCKSVQAIFDQHPKEQLKNLSFERLTDNSLLQQLESSGLRETTIEKSVRQTAARLKADAVH
jgi:hypothetical protein